MALAPILVAVAVGTATPGAAASASSPPARIAIRAIDGFPEITVPVVTGLLGPIARRINLVLDADRRTAIQAAEACRPGSSEGKSGYRREGRVTFNRAGLLSIRLTGMDGCRGGNVGRLPGARTFDLRTGAEVDVLAATGLPIANLISLGADSYDGPAECKALLSRKGLPPRGLLETAFLEDGGVTIRFDGRYSAAGRCTGSPVSIPFHQLRAATRLRPPLDRL